MKATGQCLCGAARYTANPASREVTACHCGMCRTWSGGPLFAIHCTALKFEDDSKIGIYRSSDWAERGFCKQCGTPLFYRLRDKDFFEISAETLDDKSTLKFVNQIFVDQKPAYYDFANRTKMMTGAEIFADIQARMKE